MAASLVRHGAFILRRATCAPAGLSSVLRVNFAKKIGAGKAPVGVVMERKHLDVEEDVHLLCSHVVGLNIMKDGEDPALRPDVEYPDWLWTLRTERGARPLEELDKDSWEYWHRLQKEHTNQYQTWMRTKFRFKRF